MSPERRNLWRMLLSAALFPSLLALAGCGMFDRDDRRDPLLSYPRRDRDDRDRRSDRDDRRSYDDRRSGSYTSYPGDDRPARDGNSGLSIRDRNYDNDRERNVQPSGWSGGDSGGGARMNTPTTSRTDDRPSRSSPATAGSVAPRVRSFEDAEQFLMAHGVRWQRLEQREGEWVFECSIPSRAGSGSMRTYEARDKYGLVAIQKAIENIVRDESR